VKSKVSIVFLAALLFTVSLSAQTEVQADVRYEGGSYLSIPLLGLSFTLPAGFFGGVPQGSSAMVLADNSNEITLIITADKMEEKNVFGEMQKQIPIEGSIYIAPIGMVKKEGRRWWGNYSVYGVPQEMKSYGEIRLGDHGIGVACIVLAFPAAFDRAKKAADEFFVSLKFTAPKETQVAAASGINQPWNEYLKGQSLKYYYTQGDFSDTDFLHLCSNGTFTRNKRTSSGGVTGTGTMWGGNQGTWQASGQGDSGTLILLNQDGTRAEFRIQYGQGKKGTGLYLNGSRYYVEKSTQCH
jgi:hypothetical protein